MKFKFKLEALLKLRTHNEEKAKRELGFVISKIMRLEDENRKLDNEVTQAYKGLESTLKNSEDASVMNFFEYYVTAKRSKIKKNKVKLEELNNEMEEKRKNLEKERAKVKILEKYKDKEKIKFIKEIEKKQETEIQEFYLRNFVLENKAGEI